MRFFIGRTPYRWAPLPDSAPDRLKGLIAGLTVAYRPAPWYRNVRGGIHELVHAVDRELELKLSHPQIDGVARGIAEILVDPRNAELLSTLGLIRKDSNAP